ncbi:epoxide hydrolase N-terminal domain-containing protein [Mesorhizobium sp. M0204]|uniref:epoxide hydrolase N-terminal domain-containing protein n=1 Tax=Mesorhizobium sp. M0204 TaxID=2956913 RepID=UPI00333D2B4C
MGSAWRLRYSRSGHENALPLIMTHGWPGSIFRVVEGRPSAYRLTPPAAAGIPVGPAVGVRRKPTTWTGIKRSAPEEKKSFTARNWSGFDCSAMGNPRST